MTYRRIGAALVLLLALTRPLHAQVLQSGSITTQDAGSCATANACTVFQLPVGVTALLFQVSGTYSGTLTFEATADPSTATTQTWFSIGVVKGSDGTFATTTTSTGQFSAPGAGYLQVRVRAGSFASGTATISLNRGYFVSRLMYPIFTTVTANSFVGGTYSGSTYTATSQFLAPTGTSTVPGYGFSVQPELGLYRVASDDVCITFSGGCLHRFTSNIYANQSSAGSFVIGGDARIKRTGTKTFTVDDNAGGPATFAVTGPVTSTSSLTAAASTVAFVVNARSVYGSSGNGLMDLATNNGAVGIQLASGTAIPTLSACGTGTITALSRNSSGEVTATGATACTITYVPAFSNTAHCTVTLRNAPTTTPYVSAESASAFTVSNLTAGDKFTYHCIGTF